MSRAKRSVPRKINLFYLYAYSACGVYLNPTIIGIVRFKQSGTAHWIAPFLGD